MRRLLTHKITILSVVIVTIGLLTGVAWASNGASPSQQSVAPGASLELDPQKVLAGLPSLNVLGSGFTPDKPIFVEIIVPDASNISIGGDFANSSGAFIFTVPKLRSVIFPGVYTVLATSSDGAIATAPLLVVESLK